MKCLLSGSRMQNAGLSSQFYIIRNVGAGMGQESVAIRAELRPICSCMITGSNGVAVMKSIVVEKEREMAFARLII